MLQVEKVLFKQVAQTLLHQGHHQTFINSMDSRLRDN